MTDRRPRRYLLALWEGGGNIPPELGVARRLIARGHQVHVLGDPTIEVAAEAGGCSFSPWRRGPHRSSLDPSEDPLKDWETKNPLVMLQRVRDRFIAGPAADFAADTAEEAEHLDAPRRAATLAFLEGRQPRFSTIEAARAFLADRRDDPRLAGVIARGITGSASEIRQALKNKASRSGADEIFVMSAGPSLETRIRSLELIAS